MDGDVAALLLPSPRPRPRPRAPAARHGFPTTSFGLGEWLYNQCTGYNTLHPGQQRLLAGIGITRETARAVRPRRKHTATHFQRALGCARAFADTHGTLVNATSDTLQDGLKLGQWLSNQRSKDRTHRLRHGTPSPRALAPSAINPWWNPPWTLEWQRSWHQAHGHVQDGHVLDATAGFPGSGSALATWLTTQCAQYDTLQPDQQELLTRIGITADRARGAAARPAEREADFAVGLGYTRSYHAVCGTLAAEIGTVHDGFHDSAIVSARAFGRAIGAVDDKPLLVLLNSCHSAAQSARLVDIVPFAIGMSDSINDVDAITYAARFYAAVADGQSVLAAHVLSQTAIEMNGLLDHDLPTLACAENVDPGATKLVTPPPPDEEPVTASQDNPRLRAVETPRAASTS
ncbi:helicase associated domain-containing protein [Streptomyces fructofermentans]|uniref:helicase associated domain-containing protein n=1 Tax=Streptomyces fructofermentans TaxID=152141 RepID=UPI0033F928FB